MSRGFLQRATRHAFWRVGQARAGFRHQWVYRPAHFAEASDTVRFEEVFPARDASWGPVPSLGGRAVDFAPGLCERFPAVGIAETAGALVHLQRGYVFDRRGRVLIEAAYGDWNAGKYRQPTWRRRADRELPGRTLSLLSDYAFLNYAHFLLDGLGRLAILREAGVNVGGFDHYLVPAFPGDEARRYLAAAGIPEERIVWSTRAVCYARCEALTFTSFPGLRMNYPPWLAAYLRSLVPEPLGAPGRRLYLRRRARGGNAINESAMIEVLEGFGFDALDPSELMPHTAEHLGQVSHLISLHGAALTSLVFCQPGARVLEIVPSEHRDPHYFTLARSAGLDYAAFLAESIVPPGQRAKHIRGRGPKRFDVEVDLEALTAALETMTSEVSLARGR